MERNELNSIYIEVKKNGEVIFVGKCKDFSKKYNISLSTISLRINKKYIHEPNMIIEVINPWHGKIIMCKKINDDSYLIEDIDKVKNISRKYYLSEGCIRAALEKQRPTRDNVYFFKCDKNYNVKDIIHKKTSN